MRIDALVAHILATPVDVLLVLIGVVLLALVVVGTLLPRPWRRTRARGGGTYGR